MERASLHFSQASYRTQLLHMINKSRTVCLITRLSESVLGAALETWALSHPLLGNGQGDALWAASSAATLCKTQVKIYFAYRVHRYKFDLIKTSCSVSSWINETGLRVDPCAQLPWHYHPHTSQHVAPHGQLLPTAPPGRTTSFPPAPQFSHTTCRNCIWDSYPSSQFPWDRLMDYEPASKGQKDDRSHLACLVSSSLPHIPALLLLTPGSTSTAQTLMLAHQLPGASTSFPPL